jgi:PIN domain nuclease of toxin-antitoxin system
MIEKLIQSDAKNEVPVKSPMQAKSRYPTLQRLGSGACQAFVASELPNHHKDPFDRLLIAQARSEGLTLMTADRDCRKYPVEILWCGK